MCDRSLQFGAVPVFLLPPVEPLLFIGAEGLPGELLEAAGDTVALGKETPEIELWQAAKHTEGTGR